jgi:hypothetical protein
VPSLTVEHARLDKAQLSTLTTIDGDFFCSRIFSSPLTGCTISSLQTVGGTLTIEFAHANHFGSAILPGLVSVGELFFKASYKHRADYDVDFPILKQSLEAFHFMDMIRETLT